MFCEESYDNNDRFYRKCLSFETNNELIDFINNKCSELKKNKQYQQYNYVLLGFTQNNRKVGNAIVLKMRKKSNLDYVFYLLTSDYTFTFIN